MAVPARNGAADTGPARREPSYRPDDPGWCDVKKADIAAAEIAALGVEFLVERPGHPAALALAAAIERLLEAHAGMARHRGVTEHQFEALVGECVEERVAEELAARGISRGRLRPV